MTIYEERVAALRSMIEEVEVDMAGLRREVEAMEARLASLGEEVRTRRIVLTDADGHALLSLAAADGAVELRLAAPVRVDAAAGEADGAT